MSQVLGLQLEKFRSYSNYVLHLDPGLTIIIGPNASGKTTLIEALYLLATGDSFRAGKIEEMVTHLQEMGRIQVKCVSEDDEETSVEIALTRGELQGKRVAKRVYSVNGVRRRKKDAIGKFHAVVFRPEDLRLIEGSPSRRRKFLDHPLGSLYPEYLSALDTYEKTLRRRNKLLQAVREREQPMSVLSYWNTSLVESGRILQGYRNKFIEFLNDHSVELPYEFSIVYEPSIISEDRIQHYQSRAIAAGHTLVGPHKDDFHVVIGDNSDQQHDVALYGSRGQQRLAVLRLKLGELAFLEEKTLSKPLLLLDDIFSELDSDRSQQVAQVITQYQTVLTTLDPDSLDAKLVDSGTNTVLSFES